jgi:hypothetical protein
VIGGVAAWSAPELAGVVPVEELADHTPFLGARHDGAPDPE